MEWFNNHEKIPVSNMLIIGKINQLNQYYNNINNHAEVKNLASVSLV